MSLVSWLSKWTRPDPAGRRRTPTSRGKRPGIRLRLEALEDRCLPSTFYAATASDLIADIKAANLHGGANTIVLTAPTTSPYVLTAVDNTTDGGNALPVITAGDALTIQTGNGSANPGYGDVIDASRHGRLFDVASGASLTLENVTLQNGYVFGFNATTKGGAIYNQGTLVLNQVAVRNNAVVGWPGRGQDAAGGGIWSNGSLTVENSCVFQANSAKGSDDQTVGGGTNAYGGAICIAGGSANITGSFFGASNQRNGNTAQGGPPLQTGHDSGYGGAVYVGGGTVTLSGDTFYSNSAEGPLSSGWGYGGGLCVAGGTVTLTNDYVTSNHAGYQNGFWGYAAGYGGGIYIGPAGKVYLDSFTLAHTVYNTPNNISGTYVLLP